MWRSYRMHGELQPDHAGSYAKGALVFWALVVMALSTYVCAVAESVCSSG